LLAVVKQAVWNGISGSLPPHTYQRKGFAGVIADRLSTRLSKTEVNLVNSAISVHGILVWLELVTVCKGLLCKALHSDPQRSSNLRRPQRQVSAL